MVSYKEFMIFCEDIGVVDLVLLVTSYQLWCLPSSLHEGLDPMKWKRSD